MQTLLELKTKADQELLAGRAENALALYTSLVTLCPAHFDLRLRVADALLSTGEVQRAAVVYTALARHAALAGHPLRALIALKILSTLEPRLALLLHELATLYARDSKRLGKSVRRALPDLDAPADLDALAPLEAATLASHAEAVASRYDTAGLVYPDKLMPLPLFSLLDEGAFGAVLERMQLVRVPAGTAILRQGEPGRSFFVLARGRAEVTAQRADGSTSQLATLHEGAIFGEMALLTASPRSATVSAQSECDLLEFDCAALVDASSTLQSLGEALSGFARERLLRNVVSTSPLFSPLDGKQQSDLLARFVGVEVPAGGQVIAEGEPGQGLYVVLRGEVVVTRAEEAGVALARLSPGEVFGEISILRGEPTTASVHASEAGASLLFLSRDYFSRLLTAVPELRAYFEQLSDDRMMDLRLSSAAIDGLPAVFAGALHEQADEQADDTISVEVEV